jgi:hypothetical protein
VVLVRCAVRAAAPPSLSDYHALTLTARNSERRYRRGPTPLYVYTPVRVPLPSALLIPHQTDVTYLCRRLYECCSTSRDPASFTASNYASNEVITVRGTSAVERRRPGSRGAGGSVWGLASRRGAPGAGGRCARRRASAARAGGRSACAGRVTVRVEGRRLTRNGEAGRPRAGSRRGPARPVWIVRP